MTGQLNAFIINGADQASRLLIVTEMSEQGAWNRFLQRFRRGHHATSNISARQNKRSLTCGLGRRKTGTGDQPKEPTKKGPKVKYVKNPKVPGTVEVR